MKAKITDLEKFALEHIIRPYQTGIGFGHDQKVTQKDFTLHDVCCWLCDPNKKEWSDKVIDRIKRIGFYIPLYIDHELVDIISGRGVKTLNKLENR